jgi:uncharacterized protein DUF4019
MPNRLVSRVCWARFSGLALLAFACALLSSCGATKDLHKAEQAVTEFHSQLDSENYHSIYSGAGDEFRKATSEDDLTTFLQAVHRKLGNVRQSQRGGFRVNYDAGRGEVVSLQYNTQFEGGSGSEEFYWQFKGGQPILLRYNVNSKALIVK